MVQVKKVDLLAVVVRTSLKAAGREPVVEKDRSRTETVTILN
jgi:hypothetical protein